MKRLTLYSKGLVPLGFHGTDTCLYQVPGRYIELLLLIIAACDWASLPCTRKHRRKLETLIESFGVVVTGLWRGILALEDISPLLQLKVSTSDMNATILASQY